MRYDNIADPTVTGGGQIAWHTSYWSAGYHGQFDNLTLLAQAMTGSTMIQPSPRYRSATNFSAAYVLAGLDLDPWRLALRLDTFRTRTTASYPSLSSEDGCAGTFDATWWARSWLQLIGEVIVVDSTRPQRMVEGDPAHDTERQFQLVARVYF